MPRSRRPNSHKEYTYFLPCEGKNQYETEIAARDAADFHMLENMNIDLDVYHCHVCRFWHMTNTKKTDY